MAEPITGYEISTRIMVTWCRDVLQSSEIKIGPKMMDWVFYGHPKGVNGLSVYLP